MEPGRVVVIAVLMLAVYVCFSFMGGRKGRIRLYVLSLIVALCLFGAGVAQLTGLVGVVEMLNVACITLSLAALVSTPPLWEEQLRDDLEHARVYQSMRLRDFASWRGWLKLVDRIGARKATLVYFSVFVLGVVVQVFVFGLAQPDLQPFVLLALLAPFLFAALSALWIYRGVRRVMPGA